MLVDILDPPSLKNFLKICHLQSFRRLLTLLGIWGDVSVASRIRLAQITALLLVILMLPAIASAHNVSKRDAVFVQSNTGAAIAPFLYLGAKHMVTGYDHLLFLVGVIFFLYKLKDVVQYVSLFTIGHSITLLGGVLGASTRTRMSSMPSSVFPSYTKPSTIWTVSNGFSVFSPARGWQS